MSEFKKNKKLKKFLNIENDFYDWYENYNLINESVKFLLKEDTILNLIFLGQIGTEENITLFKVEKEKKEILLYFGFLARYILDKLYLTLGEKKINWKNFKFIFIKNEKIENIIQQSVLLGSMDKSLVELFLNNYLKTI